MSYSDELKRALDHADPEVARHLLESWMPLAAESAQLFVEECRAWRRLDLASKLQMDQFRAGSDPYDGGRACLDLWLDFAPDNILDRLIDEVSSGLLTIAFRHQGDAFHLSKVREILESLSWVRRFERFSDEFVTSPPFSMHSQVLEALWRKIWALHNSLQFDRAQRLAHLYLEVAGNSGETLLSIVDEFFAFHGGWQSGLALLERLDKDPAFRVRITALRTAIAYDNGLDELFQSCKENVLYKASQIHDSTVEDKSAFASASLYIARDLLDLGQTEEGLALLDKSESQLGEFDLSGAFNLARAAFHEGHNETQAAALIEKSISGAHGPRSPFGFSAVDTCISAGRQDLAVRLTASEALALRAAYASVLEDTTEYAIDESWAAPDSAVILSGRGVGDDICRLGLMAQCARAKTYAMFLDRRLINMASAALPQHVFLNHSQVSDVGESRFWAERRGLPVDLDPFRCPRTARDEALRRGAYILQEELHAIHLATRNKNEPLVVLRPDARRIADARAWVAALPGNRPAIGICWRSGVINRTRSKSFFNNDHIARLLASADVNWVMLQYDWTPKEREEIEAASGRKFAVMEGLDLRNDLEGVAALGLACSEVFSTGVSTRELCAAAGAQVFSISYGWPRANAWRQDDQFGDTIFPNMKHSNPLHGVDSVLDQAVERAIQISGGRLITKTER